MIRRILILAATGGLVLTGCATIPKPLAGEYAPVSLKAARNGTATVTRVRWGGEIIKTRPRMHQTCFFVLAKPLDSQARPQADAHSTGRFIACKQGFYDPQVFQKGRDVTVTGTLDGTVQHKIGGYDYTYAKVRADNVYLWPKRPQYTTEYVPVPWGAWGPWFGPPLMGPWGYGPWFY